MDGANGFAGLIWKLFYEMVTCVGRIFLALFSF